MESVDPEKLMRRYGFVTWRRRWPWPLRWKKEQDAEGRQTSEPEKAHSTGEFVIVAKFGDHVFSL